MANLPKNNCKNPICSNLVDSTTIYCDQCKPEKQYRCVLCGRKTKGYYCDYHINKRIINTGQNYGSIWRKIRNQQLINQPYCEICKRDGILSRANEVDHIVPTSAGGPYYNFNNLQSLCKKHHYEKTSIDIERIKFHNEQIKRSLK